MQPSHVALHVCDDSHQPHDASATHAPQPDAVYDSHGRATSPSGGAAHALKWKASHTCVSGPDGVPSVQCAVRTGTSAPPADGRACPPEHQPQGGSAVHEAQSGCASHGRMGRAAKIEVERRSMGGVRG